MSDSMKQIVMRIEDLRESSDYTVEQMAQMLNVSVEEYRKYESGEADMSISFVRPFAGRSFIIESEVIHLGRRIVRLSAKAYDEETGKLLASGTSNFMPVSYEQHKGILGV